MEPVEPEFFDLVIAGGGMVGASLACALAPVIESRGLRVAVIEAAPPEQQNSHGSNPSYDARSTALSWNTRGIYQRMGVWPELANRATPIQSIHISDQGHFGAARLDARDQGVDALGYVLENAWLGEVLTNRVRKATGVHRLSPARVVRARHESGGARLQVSSKGSDLEIQTALLVIADGGRSNLCRDLQLTFEVQEYGQQAIVANISLTQPHHNRAYERFTPQGPLALLPLESDAAGNGRAALVWSVTSEAVDALMALDDDRFLASLQRAFGYRLGHFCGVGRRDCYPLSLQFVREQVRPGLVVMGNAAHTLHPVAGQGFNLAVRGIAALAETLSAGLEQGLGPGDSGLLQRYLSRQRSDQARTLKVTDGLVRLFSSHDLLLELGRDFGLFALDLLPAVKKSFVRRAMGMAG